MTLRIGVLGAARIAGAGIVVPARMLGHRVVTVAARDRNRAEAFAAEHGVERVAEDYAAVIDDPEVDLVYNALINSAHAEWNAAALRAGKHVLSEKPITANAGQARALQAITAGATGSIMEGFHYLHHPGARRLQELIMTGALGELTGVEIVLQTAAPPAADPRWSYDLAGGATMDLGCYVLSAARHLGRWIGATPALEAANVVEWSPGVDARMAATVGWDGLPGRLRWDMDAPDRQMVWTVTGTRGTATLPAFAVPHFDPRLRLEVDGRVSEEAFGDVTSYTYQLAAVAAHLEHGAPFAVDLDDAVANMELIDACYAAAGLQPRGH